jgi:tetratricopeptide (TPR) repeat protein
VVIACAGLIGLFAQTVRGGGALTEVRLTAKDALGAAVDVPDAKQPTVLLCLLAGQPQTGQAVAALRGVLATSPGAQVVAIVSGEGAAARVKQMTDDKFPWRIVTDADHATSGKLSVHAWPTTVIVSSTGAQVMHLAGLPKGYANDVEAYLAFAAGRIDRAAVDERIAKREMVADSPAQMAERHLQVARRVMQRGFTEQARGAVEQALKLQPDNAAVQEMMAEVLLNLGETKAAGTMLDRVERSEIGPRARLLRGRWLITAGRWDDARGVLLQAVHLNPDPAEAYYQLGLVHQHDGNWPLAAEAFRKAFEHTTIARTPNPTTAPSEK